jgi:hypothetical protein
MAKRPASDVVEKVSVADHTQCRACLINDNEVLDGVTFELIASGEEFRVSRHANRLRHDGTYRACCFLAPIKRKQQTVLSEDTKQDAITFDQQAR